MSKTPTPKPSERLARATQRARGGDTSRAGKSLSGTEIPSKAGGPPQGAVKYGNLSSALRQHVARAQQGFAPVPKIQLRPPPTLAPQAPARAQQIAPRAEAAIAPTPKAAIAIATAADLGDVVRRARIDRKLSQENLAARAGTGRRFVSELEAGKPTLEFGRLLAVCRALGIDILATGTAHGR